MLSQVWIIPIGALIGLVSIDNLSTRIPALARWLNDNPKAKSLASTLIPTVIIATVNMLVPTIIIQVSGRGQTFVTLSKLHHATWCRYWKWAMINVGELALCGQWMMLTRLQSSRSVQEPRYSQACLVSLLVKAFPTPTPARSMSSRRPSPMAPFSSFLTAS